MDTNLSLRQIPIIKSAIHTPADYLQSGGLSHTVSNSQRKCNLRMATKTDIDSICLLSVLVKAKGPYE